jgi:hypothetical protein
MRAGPFAIALLLVGLSAGRAQGQPATADATNAKPRVYGLVAAVGAQFSLVTEGPTTGTHLSPYRRTATEVPNDFLNRMALHSLDNAVAAIDPGSQRIYMSMAAKEMQGVIASKREAVAISNVVAVLQKMPERLGWDRIGVATPAYRALAQNGLESKLQGVGIFSEPMCQAGCPNPANPLDVGWLDSEPPGGRDAVRSDDQATKARTYLAPFSYIAVWILDPKTLAAIDRREGFDSQNLAEPKWRPQLDVDQADTQKYLAGRIFSLVEVSIGEALTRSELVTGHGTVEVGETRIVKPDDAEKR